MRVISAVPTVFIAIFAMCLADRSEAVTIRCAGTLKTTDDNRILDHLEDRSAAEVLTFVIDDQSKTIKRYNPEEQRLDNVCDGVECSIKITDQEASWTWESKDLEPDGKGTFQSDAGSVDRIGGTAWRNYALKVYGANGLMGTSLTGMGNYPSCEKYEQPLPLKKPKF